MHTRPGLRSSISLSSTEIITKSSSSTHTHTYAPLTIMRFAYLSPLGPWLRHDFVLLDMLWSSRASSGGANPTPLPCSPEVFPMAFPIVPCPLRSAYGMQPQPTPPVMSRTPSHPHPIPSHSPGLVPIYLYIISLALLPIPHFCLTLSLKASLILQNPHLHWLHRSLALPRLCWSPALIRDMPAYCTQDCHYFYRTALRGLNICTTVSPLYS